MRFIMDGELFELTPELVLSRLADHHPWRPVEVSD